jgi:hypothetical protein
MIDLIMAVTLGTTAGIISPNGIPMGTMTVLPLSVVPTFIVPLLLMFHIICVAQASRWAGREVRPLGQQELPSAAA